MLFVIILFAIVNILCGIVFKTDFYKAITLFLQLLLMYRLNMHCLQWALRLEFEQRDCQVRGFSSDDAMVCGRWRKLIKMVDEQEGCEWMSVSSSTGSPG